MHIFLRQCAVVVLALSVGACGSPKPDQVSGPWDIVLLDVKSGKQTGSTIRQNNYLVAYAVSAEVNAVVTSCRMASPDPQVRKRRSRDGKSDETRTGILRVWDIASGKLLAEREDPQTLHSSVWVPPSGKTFITATIRNPAQDTLAKHRFVLWDYSSGQIQEVALFEMAPRSNFAVAFTHDGQSVVICGDLLVSEFDKADVSQTDLASSKAVWVARKWSTSGGKPVATVRIGVGLKSTGGQQVARLQISADGTRLVTWPPLSNKKPNLAYQLWNLETLKRIGEPIELQPGQAPHFLNQDGTRLYTTFGSPSEQAESSYQVVEAASGKPLHPPVTDIHSLQATFAGDSESVFTLTQPEQGTWRLRLFDSAGNEKWTVDSYKNARFLASVTHRNSPISFAVFPPQADPLRK